MCRGCLFVKVDIPSGGDIDGCLKQDIIDEFKADLDLPSLMRRLTSCQSTGKEKALIILNYEESFLDEKQCKENFNQPEPKDAEEIREQDKQFFKARERAYQSFKQYISDRILRAKNLPISIVRRDFEVKLAPFLSAKNCVRLTAFMEASQ
jgi:hypothetical protein